MLKRLGRRATAVVHGRLRSRSGLLLTGDHYIEEDQEWRLGQSYLGLVGFPFLIASWLYVRIAYWGLPRSPGHRHSVAIRWDQMGWDVKLLLPIMVAWHLIAMASALRALNVWGEIRQQPREELEPES